MECGVKQDVFRTIQHKGAVLEEKLRTLHIIFISLIIMLTAHL